MKQKILYILFIVIVAIAVVVYITNNNGTIKKELTDFAVKDTASITKIFLADKSNHTITLTKANNEWKVNNKYFARLDAINILLQTINQVSVKAPVSKHGLKSVISRMSSISTKVEIYKGDDLIRVYYVGEATPDQSGTYMMLENSTLPFVTQIPGFTGYLSVRYFTDETLWRDNTVFRYSFNDISSITVEQTDAPNKKINVFNYGNNSFKVTDYLNNEIRNINVISLKEYIAHFKKLKCESYLNEFFQTKRLDSLKKTTPFAIITIKSNKNDLNILKLYRRPNTGEVYGDDGNLLPYNPDAMYGILNNSKDVLSLQYYILDPMIKGIDYFNNKNSK